MPRLAATAFLHSVTVQERKGMLKVWNMVLVALAFELSIFGTFLTRSGVVNSIHSFAKSSDRRLVPRVRRHLVALLRGVDHVEAAAAGRRGRAGVGELSARKLTFLYNNLLLVALCLTILWGVLFPS